MDETTLAVLDYPRIRGLLVDCAQTEPGRTLLQELKPGWQRPAIENEFVLTEELLQQDEDPDLAAIADIRQLLVAGAVLTPSQLCVLRTTLIALNRFLGYLAARRTKLPAVWQEVVVAQGLEPLLTASRRDKLEYFDPLIAEIDRVIDETGMIQDTASPELARLRQQQRRLRNRLLKELQVLLSNTPDLFQSQDISVRGGRFVLPLKAEARGRFEGVLHDTSDKGRTLFVEPLAALADQNELARLRHREEDEITRILEQLTATVRRQEHLLNAALRAAVRMDELLARKRFARRLRAVRPRISERDRLELVGCRHPLLMGKPQPVVPLNFVLPDETRVVVISGPNAGGKTVALKTIGLFALMLSSGLFLPCEYAEMPLFTKVFADIGDEQSLDNDLSSFSAHLLRLRQVLENADGGSLVLLDEIGGSTAPEEGSALAIAVLEELAGRGALTIATSHLNPLKAFVQNNRRMINAAMEYRDRPTYRLVMGTPGESSALKIAAQLGLPVGLLARARQYVNQDWLRFSESLNRLTAELKAAEELRQQLARETEQAAAQRKEWEARQNALRTLEAAERRRLNTERTRLLERTRREIENLVRAIREEQASRQSILAAKRYIEQELETAAKTESEVTELSGKPDAGQPSPELKVGDQVYSATLRRTGVVMGIEGSQVRVGMGTITLRLDRADLSLAAPAPPAPVVETLPEQEPFDPRLNVRGMTQAEARAALEQFLDRAVLHEATELTILHGKGTGVLRTMLWNQLRRDSRVAAIRSGEANEGGSGITFVTLKH